MHRYQAGEEDRSRMLAAVGATSIDELFSSIPEELRIDRLEELLSNCCHQSSCLKVNLTA